MFRNLLISVFFLFAFLSNQSFSQLVTKCEIADSCDLDYSSFYRAYFPTGFSMNNIVFTDENNILIFGHSDTIRIGTSGRFVHNMVLSRFTERATKKEIINVPKLAFYDNVWTSISYPDNNHIFLAADTAEFLGYYQNKNEYKYYSFLLISKDNGATWKSIYLDSNQITQKITMIDSVNGFLLLNYRNNYFNKFKGSASLLKTSDGWESFVEVQLPDDFVGLYFVANKEKWSLECYNEELESYYLNVTEDAGKTWNNSEQFDYGAAIFDVDYFNNTAYAIGRQTTTDYNSYEKGIYLKSTDGGYSWSDLKYSKENETFPYYSSSMYWFDENNGVVNSLQKKWLSRTTDGGKIWREESFPSDALNYSLNQLVMLEDDFIFGATLKNYILKWDAKKELKSPEFSIIANTGNRPITPLTIKWSKIDGAKNYRLLIKSENRDIDDITMDSPEIDTVLSDTSLYLNNLLYYKKYGFWVKAMGEDIESNWSSLIFTTISGDTVVPPPGLIYPRENSYVHEGDIELIWENVAEADSFVVRAEGQTFYLTDTTVILNKVPAYKMIDIYLSSMKTGKKAPTTFSSFFTIPSTVSVEELNKPLKQDELMVYPNPVSEDCFIHFDSESAGIAEVSVYNLLGDKLSSKSFEVFYGRNIVLIDAKNFANGTYSIQLVTGNLIKTSMFIKY